MYKYIVSYLLTLMFFTVSGNSVYAVESLSTKKDKSEIYNTKEGKLTEEQKKKQANEAKELYKSNDAKPITKYTRPALKKLEDRKKQREESKAKVKKFIKKRKEKAAYKEIAKKLAKGKGADNFPHIIVPVKTKSMSPGAVTKRKANYKHVTQPVFLFGSDEFSLSWVVKNRARLQEMKAIGLLIQATKKSDYKKVAAVTKDFTIIPISGEKLAESLKLTHYPVLLTNASIEQ